MKQPAFTYALGILEAICRGSFTRALSIVVGFDTKENRTEDISFDKDTSKEKETNLLLLAFYKMQTSTAVKNVGASAEGLFGAFLECEDDELRGEADRVKQ